MIMINLSNALINSVIVQSLSCVHFFATLTISKALRSRQLGITNILILLIKILEIDNFPKITQINQCR